MNANSFEFVTSFKINKATLLDACAFVATDTYSPFLEKARAKVIKPVEPLPTELSNQPAENKEGNFFSRFKKTKEEKQEDLRTITEERLNEGLDELTDEELLAEPWVGSKTVEAIRAVIPSPGS